MRDSVSFKILSNTHKYNTRQTSCSNFFLPRVRLKLGKCKHEFAGPSIWR